jgi:hypothetical protein
MSERILLEDLTSQQILRRLAGRAALVFGLPAHDVEGLGLNIRELAIFRAVLHRIAVKELWITPLQFRQFFGSIDKTSMFGSGIGTHEQMMSRNPLKERDAALYQKAYGYLSEHVRLHTEPRTRTTAAESGIETMSREHY